MEIPDHNDYYKRFTAVSQIKDALRDTFKNSYFVPLTEAIFGVIQKTGYSSFLHAVKAYSRTEYSTGRTGRERKKKGDLPDNGLATTVDRIHGNKEVEKNPFLIWTRAPFRRFMAQTRPA
jgi:hypothetical protein